MESGARAETFELDELLVTVVVDNATDTLSSIPDGIPQFPEMVHLLGGPAIGTHDGRDMVAVFEQLCLACHGFSVLATGRREDDVATVLFDVGPSGDVVASAHNERSAGRDPDRGQGDRRGADPCRSAAAPRRRTPGPT